MATSFTLNWPSFSVDLSMVNAYFKTNLSSNYNGLVATKSILNVYFNTDYIDTDYTAANTYWNALTSTSFNPTPAQQVQAQIQKAITFGQQLIVQYATQNVLAGVTQAGQTQAVANYLQLLQYYLSSGSLYAAINQIQTLIADTSDAKTSLSPFVTNNILYTYMNLIQTYLGVPVTPNPGS